MVTVTVQLDENLAERLQRLSESLKRTPEDLVVEALLQMTSPAVRPMPKGVGLYHSGQSNVSQNARQVLRDATRNGEWP